MADPSIVKEWLEKADDDFRFAESNLGEDGEFFAQICFHFQQDAEKYLKTFIVAKELPFGKVHDLVNLLKTCASNDETLSSLMEDCITLNAYYIETRYPVHWPTNFTRITAESAHDAARTIASAIRSRLLSRST